MMLRYESHDAGAGDAGAHTSQIAGGGATAEISARSALISVAGTVDRAGPSADSVRARPGGDTNGDADADLDSAAAALRSWVVGWTHRFDPLGARRPAEPSPAGVRRLVEAVIDVLLERRPAEQVKRWVTREVFGLLTAVTQRRPATRFAARSMVRSIQLHTPGPDAVESTVLVQDGPRVRAVALRFERVSIQGFDRVGGGDALGRDAEGRDGQGRNMQSRDGQGGNTQGRLEWRCTALQFA